MNVNRDLHEPTHLKSYKWLKLRSENDFSSKWNPTNLQNLKTWVVGHVVLALILGGRNLALTSFLVHRLQLWRELLDGLAGEALWLRHVLGLPENDNWGDTHPEQDSSEYTQPCINITVRYCHWHTCNCIYTQRPLRTGGIVDGPKNCSMQEWTNQQPRTSIFHLPSFYS